MINFLNAHGECFAKQNVTNHRPYKFLFGISFVTNCLRQFTQDERRNKKHSSSKKTWLLLSLLVHATTKGNPTSNPQPHWQFSPQFLTTYHRQEVLQEDAVFVASTKPNQNANPTHVISQTTIKKAINIAAFAYACMRIYNRYQAMHTPAGLDDSWTGSLKNALSIFCPALIQSIGAHGLFFIDSTGIVFETLVYKAIAKLIVLCAYGDIGDFIKGAVSATSSMVCQLITN